MFEKNNYLGYGVRKHVVIDSYSLEEIEKLGYTLSPFVREAIDMLLSLKRECANEELFRVNMKREVLMKRRDEEVKSFIESLTETFRDLYTNKLIEGPDMSIYPENMAKLLVRKKGITIEEAREEIERIRAKEEEKALIRGYPKRTDSIQENDVNEVLEYGERDENDYW